MQTFSSVSGVPEGFGPSAVTIGKFDGMHLGHRAVVSALLDLAHDRGLTSTVLTFDRNPLSLLRPEICPPALASNAQKLESLAAAGVDATLLVRFDHEFSELTAAQFMQQILVEALHAVVVLVGTDFRFGHRGEGTVETLVDFGRDNSIDVMVIDDVAREGSRRVSSTAVRNLILEGNVAEAAELLGAPHRIRGTVVHGAQRGRTLGYPTANLSPSLEGLVPADGVYAAWMTVDGERYPSAVSIGNNPTFEGVPAKQVEAHALDADVDLYGRVAEIAFVDTIRGMRKFDGTAALIVQMQADEVAVRSVLGVARKVQNPPVR
ncbi:riboflavin kinase/FMN adenylyltransferase [Salinibacterium sp. CAN_S4]|uniref:bifunctional riboflavin kinase/FAD synthetase n=1 Tax=Salinibacterium sp. CAN_S4 TaxID=2787727 RepID=UPI0018F04FC7